jgi:hypothetical protein
MQSSLRSSSSVNTGRKKMVEKPFKLTCALFAKLWYSVKADAGLHKTANNSALITTRDERTEITAGFCERPAHGSPFFEHRIISACRRTISSACFAALLSWLCASLSYPGLSGMVRNPLRPGTAAHCRCFAMDATCHYPWVCCSSHHFDVLRTCYY